MPSTRLPLKAIATLAMTALGAKAIGDGWHVLGTREFRVEGGLGHGVLISIDGGYGEVALGVLLLSWAWMLLRRWFLDLPSPGPPGRNTGR